MADGGFQQTFAEPMQTSHLAPKVQEALDREKQLLDGAFTDLLWISEYPNRNPNASDDAVALAEYARQACVRIES